MNLTVAIPTFDRNSVLEKSLAALLPQLDDQIQLLIIDNASPVSYSEALAPLLAGFPNVRAKICRNVANIGGSANVLRCIEQTQTEWVWTLGDDDKVAPDAIAKIRLAIEKNPDATVINFYAESGDHPPRTEQVVSHGAEEFLSRADSIGAILFMSSSVFRARHMIPNLKAGYHYAYSCAPHLAVLLTALGESGQAVYSHRSIVDAARADTPLELLGTRVPLILGLTTLLELPLPSGCHRELRRLFVDAARTWLGIPGLLTHVAPIALQDKAFARHLLNTAANRLYKLDSSVAMRLKVLAARILLINPRLGMRIVGRAYSLAKGTTLTPMSTKDFASRT